MNVASLENCKRLYGLSGWQDVEQYWEYYPATKDALLKKSAPGNTFPDNKLLPDLITPAYDLGYLLRKLPSFVETRNNSYRLHIMVRNLNNDKEAQMGYSMLRQVAHGRELIEFKNPRREAREYGFEQLFWSPDKNSYGKAQVFFGFGTLEDAACLLAIKLFEEKIL